MLRWAVLLVAACVESTSVRCPDGSLCPDGTQCASVDEETLCVDPDQVAACVGKAELDTCAENRRCYDGVCLAAGCGNKKLDPGEACDDGNTVALDGCSADCLSDEKCGNNVVDVFVGEQCDDGPDSRALSHDGCASDCSLELAQWREIPPLGETGEAAIAHDASRDRLVMFANMRTTAQTWEWDGARWMLQTPRVSPVPRSSHAMAYDHVRKRIVLFGGDSFNDTWEWDGTAWTLRSPATSPPARNRHAMVFDPRRKRIVMFGGRSATQIDFLSDTWAWDGDNWTQITSAMAPSAREHTALAYDPKRDVVVLFGGFITGNTANDETWELSGSTWTKRTPATVPPARSAHGMAFDPRSGLVVMHGGSGLGTRSDTYLWNGTDWALHPTAGPAISNFRQTTILRDGQVIAFDRGRLFKWDAGWTLFEDSAQIVPPRFSMAAAADVAGRRIVIHGGTESTVTASTMVWTGAWQRFTNAVVGSSPGRVSDAAMAYDARNQEFIHFGGLNATTGLLSNETWAYRTAWTQKAPAMPLPEARTGPGMAYDEARERVVLFGGRGAALLDDTWLWTGTAWMAMPVTTRPSPRETPALAYDPVRQIVVLFGGFGTSSLGDTWEWNGSAWQQRMAPGPPPRSNAGMAWDTARRRVVLFGGVSGSQTLNDQWEWDGTTWSQVPVLETIRPRANHVVLSGLDSGILAFGGTGEGATQFSELRWLRWNGNAPDEICDGSERDGDNLLGCADADCWRVCKPSCQPGAMLASTCGAAAPGCGDGTCNRVTESCSTCAMDCTCPARCGDLVCDANETTVCPGDCP